MLQLAGSSQRISASSRDGFRPPPTDRRIAALSERQQDGGRERPRSGGDQNDSSARTPAKARMSQNARTLEAWPAPKVPVGDAAYRPLLIAVGGEPEAGPIRALPTRSRPD